MYVNDTEHGKSVIEFNRNNYWFIVDIPTTSDEMGNYVEIHDLAMSGTIVEQYVEHFDGTNLTRIET